jgi:alkyl sulfatase BDS1-like metallo-beta-lactamase superfamily hydrolase
MRSGGKSGYVTLGTILISLIIIGCARRQEIHESAELPSSEILARQCKEEIGEPRVEEPLPGLFVAIGYDLANTILLKTSEGNVVVDVSMSPARAGIVRQALLARAPGRTRAIIYTHSHIDHVGGASVWVEHGTEIWATEAFRDHLIKQYGLFQATEARRGGRQFGRHVSEADLPCSALGRRPDLEAAANAGIRFPTRTFSGQAKLTIGGVELDLVEAHGETHDQLFVWIPSRRALLSGDNFYSAYPNLYTIRGTRPRPVDEWIASIDRMRRLEPDVLVPSHTRVRRDHDAIQEELRNYRDGIQWLRDEVVRRANAGADLDTIADQAGLPPHLAADRNLQQLYGQFDWSARAIYGNELGWFDGRPELLYPVPAAEALREEIALMGGVDRVLAEARAARDKGNLRWAIHLLAKLQRSGLVPENRTANFNAELARALRGLAAEITNTNGRAYLLESAWEIDHGFERPKPIRTDDAFLTGIPLKTFFTIMTTRLLPEKSLDALEAVEFHFKGSGEHFFVTIRHGIAEVSEDTPLPGTPAPLAVVDADPLTWRRLALNLDGPARAVASGRLKVSGSWLGFLQFMNRFSR